MAIVRREVERPYPQLAWQQAAGDDEPTGADCPSCRHPMSEVNVPTSQAPSLHLDVCGRCHLLWFDPHEFEQLPPKAAAVKTAKEIPPEAAELLAKRQLELNKLEDRGADFGSAAPEEAWKWFGAMLGLPIEHDADPIERWPLLTWGIAAALVVVFLLSFGQETRMAERFGLIPADAFRGNGLTLVTSFLIHAGWIHLLGNTYFLLVFGDNVEDYLGRGRYLVLLVGAALAGDLAFIMMHPDSHVPCVGASGGISGIIVYYALQFPQARIGVLFWYWYYLRWFYFPAWFALVGWLGFQLLTVYLETHELTNVAATAHIGGAIVGIVVWLVWRDR